MNTLFVVLTIVLVAALAVYLVGVNKGKSAQSKRFISEEPSSLAVDDEDDGINP